MLIVYLPAFKKHVSIDQTESKHGLMIEKEI